MHARSDKSQEWNNPAIIDSKGKADQWAIGPSASTGIYQARSTTATPQPINQPRIRRLLLPLNESLFAKKLNELEEDLSIGATKNEGATLTIGATLRKGRTEVAAISDWVQDPPTNESIAESSIIRRPERDESIRTNEDMRRTATRLKIPKKPMGRPRAKRRTKETWMPGNK
jgi:hypothetical protein